MKNFTPAIIVLSTFVLISAFLISDNDLPGERPVVVSPETMDQLTDELLYLVQLSDAAEKQIYDNRYREFAATVKSDAMAGNRRLCSLIIQHQIPARRELQSRHRQGIFSIVSLNRQEMLAEQYQLLLQEEFAYIDQLLAGQVSRTEDPIVLDFYQQLKERHREFGRKLVALQQHNDLLVQR